MKGWKTWLACAGLVALAVVDFVNNDTQAGIEKLTGALACLGIGHKIEKAAGG
jgi:hypothetical protein